MISYIAKRPWLLVVAGFALLVGVWTCFIYIAVTRGPMTSPLEASAASIHADH
jgi:hypothetical protein